MHLAIGMWALLAGGIILPPSNDGTNSTVPSIVGPYVSPTTIELPQSVKSATPASTDRPADTKNRNLPPLSSYRQPSYGSGYGTPAARPRFMPWAPTDSSAVTNQFMPLSPTAGSGLSNAGGISGRAGRFGLPRSGFGTGLGRAPGAFSSGSQSLSGYSSPSFSSLELCRAQTGPARIGTNLSSTSALPGGKIGGSYNPPPAVSPYMNIFNSNTRGVDPYNLYVRPALQQQQQNMQFNNDIGGLQTQTEQLLAPTRPPDSGALANPGYINPQVNPSYLPTAPNKGQ